MKYLLFTFCILSFIACGGSASQCVYGSPTAIFSPDLEKISKHQFKVNGQNGMEAITFTNGLQLEILQGGCNAIKQEFRFVLPGKTSETAPEYWIATVIQLFHMLGEISEKHLVYHQYGKAIEEKGPQINLGESFTLENGFNFKIDHIAGNDQNILVVVATQGTNESD